MTVAQRDIPAAVLGDLRVVGDEDNRASLGVQALEEHQDLERGTGIQVAGSLIRKDHRRIVHQGTAIATRCIWPPDIWLLLCISRSPKPTAIKALTAFSLRWAAL